MTLTRDEEEISKTRYPLLVCCLAAEFLTKLGKLNTKYTYKCQSVADSFLKLGENLQKSMKEEDTLNHFLRTQTDILNRSALEIIAQNRFYNLLNNENVASIVNKLWYGTGKNTHIFQFCKITRILVYSNIFYEKYEDSIKPYTEDELNSKTFSFQYTEYINNCSVRYLVDSFSTLMSTILFQIIIYIYVELKKGNFTTEKESVEPFDDSSFNFFNNIASIVVYSNIVQVILFFVYLSKTGRKIKLSTTNLIDISVLIAVTLNILNFKSILNFDLKENSQETKNNLSQLSIFVNPTDNGFVNEMLIDTNLVFGLGHLSDTIIFSVIIICAWARVIMILVTTRSFGPFIRIVYLIFQTMVNFMIVYCCFNTVSAQIFTMFFKVSNPDFDEFFKSWVELFNNSFGINNFGSFSSNGTLGDSLLIAYTTISNVMLLNLVVSIADNLYQQYESEADSENRAVLVLTYERIKWDPMYGLLILLPAPLNLICIPFIILLFAVETKKREAYNEMFSKICYFIIALLNFFLMIIVALFAIPFAVMKSLVHSAYDNYRSYSIINLFLGITQIIIRPMQLIYLLGKDMLTFWKICYLNNTIYIKNKEEQLSLISRPVINLIRKTLIEYRMNTKKKIISTEDLFKYLKVSNDHLQKELIKDKEIKSKMRVKEDALNSSKINEDNLSYNKDSDANNINVNNNNSGIYGIQAQMKNFIEQRKNTIGSKLDLKSSNSNKYKDYNSEEMDDKRSFKQRSNNKSIIRKNRFPSFFPSNNLNQSDNNNSDNNNSKSVNSDNKSKEDIEFKPKLNKTEQAKIRILEESDLKLNRYEAKLAIRYLCDKVADKDKMVNIERTLTLLPYRVRLSTNYLRTMEFLDMKFIIRGLRSFFFDNALNNPTYSYKKLQQMLIKITIKMKTLHNFIPNSMFENILKTNMEINNNELYQKNYANIKRLEELDELSDFDEEQEFLQSYKISKKASKENSGNTSPTQNKSKDNISNKEV